MAETNVFERTFERTLCDGTYQVSGIHQNTSYFIFCTTTRPKLLINDCVKEQLLSIPIFNCLQLVCLYARISRRFSTDYYRPISFRKYNFLQLLSEYYKNIIKKQQQIYKDSSDKKSSFLLIVQVETFS